MTKPLKGTRMPDDWLPTESDLAYLAAKLPGMTATQTDEFVDAFTFYWQSAAGANALKTDWSKTFKGHVLNRKKYLADFPRKPTYTPRFGNATANDPYSDDVVL
jgi:hypothetical protein